MDLETENRIASILMREAAELRRQADKEGVHAYLLQPKVRGRPNSRFLTATVRGVQQANRVVEMGEMWRVRQKEIELENKLQGKSRDVSNHSPSTRETETTVATVCTPRKRKMEECNTGENGSGLRDEEVEEFLHSRVKRGRGAVGSRMDETGPYLPSRSDLDPNGKFLASLNDARVGEDWEHRALLGPDKPSFLKKTSRKSSSSESDSDQERSWRKEKRDESRSKSKKHYSEKKHKSKDKYRDKKKTKKSKHHHRSRSEYTSRISSNKEKNDQSLLGDT
ncbi:hypothetical protein MKX01_002708 [Papaver californicum]|nr:hypothetical protein MKX01_002708 [Papaver californicum]